jgi:hypothetical protein
MVVSKKELALTKEDVLEILELRIPEYIWYWVGSRNNFVKVGSKAGYVNKDGYTQIQINGNTFYAHRLVWFIVYGTFPDDMIDHVDGVKSNNKIDNLRNVSCKTNNQNTKKYRRADDNLPTGVVVGHRTKSGEPRDYRAQWSDMEGKQQRVYFTIRAYGSQEGAIAAATAKRELEIAKLKELGANYTNRHGLP